jgi:hypothetical protein
VADISEVTEKATIFSAFSQEKRASHSKSFRRITRQGLQKYAANSQIAEKSLVSAKSESRFPPFWRFPAPRPNASSDSTMLRFGILEKVKRALKKLDKLQSS